MKEEEKIAKVIGLMKQTSAPPKNSLKPLPVLGKKVVIKGDMNHFAEGSTQLKVVLVGPPSVVLISKTQKAALVERRDQWVDLHNTVKARQITRSDARKALNAKAKVTAHRLIPAARYADLMGWLEARIAALRTAAQRLTESNRRDLGALRPIVATPDDANPDTDLTPPHKERPPARPALAQIPERRSVCAKYHLNAGHSNRKTGHFVPNPNPLEFFPQHPSNPCPARPRPFPPLPAFLCQLPPCLTVGLGKSA